MEDLIDKSLMPWGKYKGEKMANVPASYLLWCLDNGTCCERVRKYILLNKADLSAESKKPLAKQNYRHPAKR